MKNSIGDLVANSMLNVLNSKEHAQLFKKAYKEVNCEHCQDEGDCSMCGDGAMDYNKASDFDSYGCASCGAPPNYDLNDMHDENGHCARCAYHFKHERLKRKNDDFFDGDDSGANDQNWSDDSMMDETSMGGEDDEDMLGEPSDENWASELDRKTAAYYEAMQDLITASAALDYANFGKASELAIKIAALVSESKKKEKASSKDKAKMKGKAKMKMKGKKPAFLTKKDEKSSASSKSSGKSSGTSASSKPSSSSASSKSSKKMTIEERMKALRAKKK